MGVPASVLLYVLAALAEIGGCFAFWAWAKLDKSPLWLIPGMVLLAGFAWALTRIDAEFAGRAYAAYGGIYVATSVLWMWLIEGQSPSKWDLLGGAICVLGAVVILVGPKLSA